MAAIGNDQVNPHPCTPGDALLNWQVQATINNTFLQTINEAGVLDTYKVKVDTAGADPTADYLHNKLEQATPPTDSHFIACRSETTGGYNEQIYWDVQEISGYDAGVEKYLRISGGIPSFTSISATTDTFKVKATTDDLTESFLHDAFYYNSTYVSGADMDVSVMTTGGAGTNQKELPFVDVSRISEWTGTGVQLLGQNNNATQFFTVAEVFGSAYSAGCGIDSTALSTGSIKVNRTALIGSGLAADSGTCNIKVNTNVTVKVPTSITLSHAGSTLTLTMAYQEYQIYGVAGSTGNLTATFDTTTC